MSRGAWGVLAATDPRSLPEDERLLARYLRVRWPSGTDPSGQAALSALDGVELVSLPPRMGLS